MSVQLKRPLGIEIGSPLLKDCPDFLCPIYKYCKDWNEKRVNVPVMNRRAWSNI